MIRGVGAFAALTLRIALSTWFVLVALAVMLGTLADVVLRGVPAQGPAAAFLAALIVFPPIALGWGLWCAWRQRVALAGIDEARGLLSVGCRATIHLELPASQALRIADSVLRGVFIATRMQANEVGITARISDTCNLNALMAWRFEDNLALSVLPRGKARCELEIGIDPVHGWMYGLLTVDAGRCATRLRMFEDALRGRIGANNAVADDAHGRQVARASRAESQLAMLRAHVEPHFIFNTLAHVRASLGGDNGPAAAMLDALVDFMRRNSQALNRDEISLREELWMVESYLRIIGLRHAELLRYDLDCPQTLFDRMVPAACILVLVENAVKHGIERSAAGGRISVRCAVGDDGVLLLTVRNDGPPFEAKGGLQGGLSNLQERLKLLYGGSRLLEIEHPETGGVQVSVTLPPRVQA